jgi:glycosyltransferase involved in cell wall biosynthesis
VRDSAKERLLRGAWALALPSHVEALPMAVLESLAAGVPVVATRVGAIPSAVEDGRAGLLVAPRDVGALSAALVRLLGDAGLRKAMGRAARQRALEEFSSEVVVPRVEALWREIAPRQELGARAHAA